MAIVAAKQNMLFHEDIKRRYKEEYKRQEKIDAWIEFLYGEGSPFNNTGKSKSTEFECIIKTSTKLAEETL
jgi:hypothetical protein